MGSEDLVLSFLVLYLARSGWCVTEAAVIEVGYGKCETSRAGAVSVDCSGMVDLEEEFAAPSTHASSRAYQRNRRAFAELA